MGVCTRVARRGEKVSEPNGGARVIVIGLVSSHVNIIRRKSAEKKETAQQRHIERWQSNCVGVTYATSSVLSDHRIVNINPTNDPLQTHFTNNRVKSHKYTIWNFIPKNFFEQFRRIANFYFLLTTIITLTIDSPISPLTSALPLSFVILVTACKQGYEDYLRYKTDQRDNQRSVNVIRNKCTQDIYCEQIVVGDLVKVSRDEDVPCDIILLYSETPGCCYVTTSNLDGETNLKTLNVPKVVSKLPLSHIVAMEATITCQHPLANLYTFHELQKFLGSLFFAWDLDMYDAANDQPALANTSDLNEELGQVEYLFTDKTGTLTENLMVFRRCSIDGNIYMEKDCDGNLYLLPSSGNEDEAVKLTSWEENIWHFMISISLCHMVQIAPPSLRPEMIAKRISFRESFRLKKITRVNSSLMMHPDLPQYQAASADEKALVEASARCGVIFQKGTNEAMYIRINKNMMIFQKLEILEFTSERKRMSIIVKDSANDIWLYCKGADSAVLPLIVQGKIQEASLHVADFSMRGLRTLVIAYKKMDQSEYNRLSQNIEQARQIIGTERETYMTRAYNLMESELTLLGVTAVEDRLQDDVQETLECLRVAGIKIWVLTGDKAETAENIAFLCGHFKKGTEVLRLMEETSGQSCFLILTTFDRKIKLEPHKQYGLIIDGTSMAATLRNCPELLKSIGMACEAVVCCRLTPLQKSEIVHLIKTAQSRPHTAAIGDGGNDVSMIQEAHVGIGILGKEGRQASISADFAFTKFMYLKKALLVHGHWYYLRISILMQYFFYKNVVFITPQVLFGVHNGFSTQELYDGIFLMCFNLLFTSLPILLYGLFEQNHSAKKLMRHPYLYKLNKRNYLMSRKQFMVWLLLGLWHTGITYFTVYCISYINPTYLYDNTPVGHWTFSTCIFHIVTLLANLQILLRSSYWTFPLILSIILSELVFFLSAFCYSVINVKYDGDMFGVFYRLLMSPSFWLITIIVVVICLIPDYLLLTYDTYRPMKILRRNEEPPQPLNCSDHDSERSSSQAGYRMFPWRGSLSFQKTE
ncbi:phospholipid-transporting ATPase IF-like isoform X4 [Cataglyphis hispanica]|uniref:phospholipid-transporting ATPase IF-like isoform X4 n=1 Tax=Cataglyphis hispanica TaxID=1086592 RepID=UPI00217F8741|nr:phospholipid-transporting ATPase IF-like isoform X4 [Cataglyphis hispanica]